MHEEEETSEKENEKNTNTKQKQNENYNIKRLVDTVNEFKEKVNTEEILQFNCAKAKEDIDNVLIEKS